MLLLPQRGFFSLSLLSKQTCAKPFKRPTAVWAKLTAKLRLGNNDAVAPLHRWTRSVCASYLKLWHITLLMLAARAESKQWLEAWIWFWMDTNWFSSMLSALPAGQQFLKMTTKQPLPHTYLELLEIGKKTMTCLQGSYISTAESILKI